MKSFKVLLFISAAASLLACSQDDAINNISYDDVIAATPTPIEFGTYLGEQAVTRAGTAGNIDDAQDLATNKGGVGVFAYYTQNGNYPASNTTLAPNFMYNQHVTGTDAATPAWSYTPVKYWPNEYGTDAASTNTDKLSFFAYAPYVEVTGSTGVPTSGSTTEGITALTKNSDNGDPKVSYTFTTDPAKSVDLMYGVAASAITDGPATNNIAEGNALIDITKQSTNGEIKFKFKHALARVELQVVGAFDVTNSSTDYGTKGTETKITVKSVKITGSWAPSDQLNLKDGAWSGATAASNVLTIDSSNALNTDIADPATDPATYGAITNDGVTQIQAPVIAKDESGNAQYLMFIPSASTNISGVEIVYYVNTKDENLADGMSRVENNITKNLDTALTLDAGKAYKLVLTLGMTSVKLNAQVATWDDATTKEVWLPVNN